MAEHGIISISLRRAWRPEKLVTLLLLFILLTAATAGVTSVLIGPDWGSLWRGLTFGLLIGWTLAILKQPAWRAGLITTAVGVAYALMFSGGLSGRVDAIFSALINMPGRIAASPQDVEANIASLAPPLQELFNAAGVVIDRVRFWTMALIAGEPAFDPVAAAIVWGILVWLIAAWAGWIVQARRNALLASLPALMLSLATLSYGRRESAALYFMLGSVLLLLAIVQIDRHRLGWEKAEVAYPPRKGRQVGNAAVIVVLALVALSAILSSISLPRIVEWASELAGDASQQEGRLAKSLGIMAGPTPTPDIFEDVRRPGLPREQLIGSGPELSRRRVMTIEIEEYASVSKARQLSPLYWRSFTYDVYTGHGWQTSSTTSGEYQSNETLRPPQAPYHILIRQTVRSSGDQLSVLYTAGEPVAINQHSDAAWRSNGDLFGVQISSTAGYIARSLLPAAGEGSLRSAGQNYPDWVKQDFLSLPSEVPARVRDLAIQLTAAERTPYDRARAIERYLRSISYTLDVPHPPSGQDLVDYFLFELRKGYCDYYASAMVVLARAAGIPARFAVGYANGTYDLNSERFVVTEADAHSWVEVYFPGVGWVAFEPTAGRPALENTQALESTGTDDPATSDELADAARPEFIPNGRLILLSGLAVIGILVLIFIVIDEIRLRRYPEFEAAGEVYRRMKRYGSSLSAAPAPGDTPYEFAALLSTRLRELSFNGRTPPVVANLPEKISEITDRIVQTSYRPSFLNEKGGETVYSQWRSLRWRLRLMWVIGLYKSLYERLKGRWIGVFNNARAGAEQEA